MIARGLRFVLRESAHEPVDAALRLPPKMEAPVAKASWP